MSQKQDQTNGEDVKGEEEKKQKLTAHEWEMVRAGLSLSNKGKQQEEWMTKLPEVGRRKVLDFDLMQRNVTRFSAKGVSDRGDTSIWTDTPDQREQKQQQQHTKVTAAEAMARARQHAAESEVARTQHAAHLYNKQHRATSLLEQHLEKQYNKEEKEKKKPKSKHKHKHKHKQKHKHKDKDKDKRKHKRKDRKRKRDDDSSSSSEEHISKKSKKKELYWDRDRDLSSSRVDPNKRNKLITQSTKLNSRFASSASSYL